METGYQSAINFISSSMGHACQASDSTCMGHMIWSGGGVHLLVLPIILLSIWPTELGRRIIKRTHTHTHSTGIVAQPVILGSGRRIMSLKPDWATQ